MELISIPAPNITRIQYANKECEDIWSEKIKKGIKLYPQLEMLTVEHGIRKCMIAHHVQPHSMEQLSRQLAKRGLFIVPLSKNDVNENGFGHMSPGHSGGKYVYRAVISKSLKDASLFVDAHEANDDIEIGQLLGFPKKSCEFFDEVWKKGYFDPIWQQAENTIEMCKNKKEYQNEKNEINKKLIRLKEHEDFYKISSVFRYIGIRILSHFPYSFEDKESLLVANEWIKLARDLKLEGLDECLEIMKLPYEWDCYKGLAIINTPVMKIVTSSMPCYPKHVIQQESDFYPLEAPKGIQFPWKINYECK